MVSHPTLPLRFPAKWLLTAIFPSAFFANLQLEYIGSPARFACQVAAPRGGVLSCLSCISWFPVVHRQRKMNAVVPNLSAASSIPQRLPRPASKASNPSNPSNPATENSLANRHQRLGGQALAARRHRAGALWNSSRTASGLATARVRRAVLVGAALIRQPRQPVATTTALRSCGCLPLHDP
jgi:hypothetical protein